MSLKMNSVRLQGIKVPFKYGAAFRGSKRRVVKPVTAFLVRPYTVRKGDTLSSVAKKRGFTVEELLSLNDQINPDFLVEGQTLIVPAGKLSSRDKDILEGIGPSSYRTYPVRAGENIQDIISKRGISMEEIEQLNPEADFSKKLEEGQIIKLPPNKFTVREKEMMLGSNIVPPAFFAETGRTFGLGVFIGALVAGLIVWWNERSNKEDSD
eukprot:TRINITY_DN3865_c0_g2_i3.p3 TRINITY_DN3865_c0_g2~~TRINITY_DN3865_c0_g2_i3.p3  ORF type:complete len:210 (+),score=47.37 TRINITY_DN3865_c0_g2_i3:143-772(+)